LGLQEGQEGVLDSLYAGLDDAEGVVPGLAEETSGGAEDGTEHLLQARPGEAIGVAEAILDGGDVGLNTVEFLAGALAGELDGGRDLKRIEGLLEVGDNVERLEGDGDRKPNHTSGFHDSPDRRARRSISSNASYELLDVAPAGAEGEQRCDELAICSCDDRFVRCSDSQVDTNGIHVETPFGCLVLRQHHEYLERQ
jgi:hypothetical protein